MTGFLNGRTEARFPKPAKRVKPKQRIRRKARRKAKLHDADRLFSQYIRTRDGWECQRCRSPFQIQCAHIIGRSYRAVRFSALNALALCQACHVYYTHRPLEFQDFIEEKFPGRWAMLKAKALAAHEHPDYDAICDQFKAAIGVK